jgi:hypothetical protein
MEIIELLTVMTDLDPIGVVDVPEALVAEVFDGDPIGSVSEM